MAKINERYRVLMELLLLFLLLILSLFNKGYTRTILAMEIIRIRLKLEF